MNIHQIDKIIGYLEAGLRAENQRQRATANNVANLETPGYRGVDVKFEELIAKALDSGSEVEAGQIEPQIYEIKQTPVKSNGNDVSLEDEIGRMVKNTLRHTAYVRLLNKKYQQIQLAIDVK
jgi:flagellar basal-body rod protein FlgB